MLSPGNLVDVNTYLWKENYQVFWKQTTYHYLSHKAVCSVLTVYDDRFICYSYKYTKEKWFWVSLSVLFNAKQDAQRLNTCNMRNS